MTFASQLGWIECAQEESTICQGVRASDFDWFTIVETIIPKAAAATHTKPNLRASIIRCSVERKASMLAAS